jgi:hypothetical protein
MNIHNVVRYIQPVVEKLKQCRSKADEHLPELYLCTKHNLSPFAKGITKATACLKYIVSVGVVVPVVSVYMAVVRCLIIGTKCKSLEAHEKYLLGKIARLFILELKCLFKEFPDIAIKCACKGSMFFTNRSFIRNYLCQRVSVELKAIQIKILSNPTLIKKRIKHTLCATMYGLQSRGGSALVLELVGRLLLLRILDNAEKNGFLEQLTSNMCTTARTVIMARLEKADLGVIPRAILLLLNKFQDTSRDQGVEFVEGFLQSIMGLNAEKTRLLAQSASKMFMTAYTIVMR